MTYRSLYYVLIFITPLVQIEETATKWWLYLKSRRMVEKDKSLPMIHLANPTVKQVANIIFTWNWDILISLFIYMKKDRQTACVIIMITTGHDWEGRVDQKLASSSIPRKKSSSLLIILNGNLRALKKNLYFSFFKSSRPGIKICATS